jgi:hypothetical protein
MGQRPRVASTAAGDTVDAFGWAYEGLSCKIANTANLFGRIISFEKYV